jgi:hypothetical protein
MDRTESLPMPWYKLSVPLNPALLYSRGIAGYEFIVQLELQPNPFVSEGLDAAPCKFVKNSRVTRAWT